MSGKTLDFAARMAARNAVTKDGEPKAETNQNLIPIRRFNDAGKKRVLEILEQVRTQNDLFKDEVEELLTDPEYSEEIAESYKIDPTRVFHTKLDLCRYFTEEVFPDSFLESAATRADTGLWTWLAIAYYTQFVKVKKGVVKLASDARWVYDRDNYRLSMRHFIAGAVYLYYDFRSTDEQVKDMLFSSSPQEFGGFVDAITYKMEGTRLPVLMQVAAWLYYDPKSEKKMKKGVISQDKPGTIRQFLRVAAQFAQTRDFYGVEDAHELWVILPKQFDGFKGVAMH